MTGEDPEGDRSADRPADAAAAVSGLDVERVLGRIRGASEGPTLIFVAGLHGNEPAGVQALQRVFPELEANGAGRTRGGRGGRRESRSARIAPAVRRGAI